MEGDEEEETEGRERVKQPQQCIQFPDVRLPMPHKETGRREEKEKDKLTAVCGV